MTIGPSSTIFTQFIRDKSYHFRRNHSPAIFDILHALPYYWDWSEYCVKPSQFINFWHLVGLNTKLKSILFSNILINDLEFGCCTFFQQMLASLATLGYPGAVHTHLQVIVQNSGKTINAL